METLEIYLDGLFARVPNTPATQKAKQDLLDLMMDHYHEELAKGQSEAAAVGLVISEFGDIDELLATLEVTPDETAPAAPAEPVLSDEEATAFWAGTECFARYLALGIALIPAGIGVTAWFSGTSDTLAALSFFGCTALGVGLIIAASLGYRDIVRHVRAYATDQHIRDLAAVEAAAYSRPHLIGLVGGIMMCILSVVPPIVDNAGNHQGVGPLGFFLFVAVGVYFIVYTSIVAGGFKRLLRGTESFAADAGEDPTTPSAQAMARAARHERPRHADRPTRPERAERPAPQTTRGGLRAFYWPVLTTLFFLFGFLVQEWRIAIFILIVGGLFERPLLGRQKR
ncbi:permease prefix domain 1-containing protein [Lacticaseibacillus daqingensis]|uniref:permease prefix domain 1-containing protein n=1 Tax=Lacticaseibacillus daqingensis TaxID=2486014 RepID=UPI000F7B2BBA|nr:permease prefix domain 1-containing protein [Lacticaseibacillus daqingensis]